MAATIASAVQDAEVAPDSVNVAATEPGLAVMADAMLLERSLDNVISNAVRHNESTCPVRIDAAAVNNEVHIRVDHRGPGIARRAIQGRTTFQRLGDQATAGVGLGLSIAEGSSKRWAGHSHSTTRRRRSDSDGGLAADEWSGRMKSKILVVDDEPQIRKALKLNLEVRGYDVLEASTGETALSLTRASTPTSCSSISACRESTARSVVEGRSRALWSDVPVIVLTARTDEPSKVRLLDLGVDHYVTKPFGMPKYRGAHSRILRTTRDADRAPREEIR